MENEKRSADFSRNDSLEALMREVNSLLAPANKQLVCHENETYAKIFVHGPLRSGTTLFIQWLADSGYFGYPTNLLSRFYGAPLVGAKIQQLLTDVKYNFRNEILDFSKSLEFRSENGKTRGALSPNEFWYFWRRFLPFIDLDYLPDSELLEKADLEGLRGELNGLSDILQKPFALKSMIMNQNIPVLDKTFEKAIFVWVQRDPVFNIQSALEARRRQSGNIGSWYSFKIKEYPELSKLDALNSVAGQVYAINSALSVAFSRLPEHRKLIVKYENFCSNPQRCFDELVSKLAAQNGIDQPVFPYKGVKGFDHTNYWRLEEYSRQDAENAYARWQRD